MFLRFTGEAPPCDLFVRHYLERGGARPWLKELLQTLEWWKRSNRIDEVAIFTAASNHEGWVTFVRKCMEAYAGTGVLFGRCISRETSPLATTSSGVRTIKDLSLISTDAECVVLLDDKPEYAMNGYVVGVPEYSQDVPIHDLAETMKLAMPDFASEMERVFAHDRETHPPSPHDFSNDDALRNVVPVLAGIFPERNNCENEQSVLASCSQEGAHQGSGSGTEESVWGQASAQSGVRCC
eukprot:TRINITY_DN3187_c0_g1_i3.p1 TRINITY_DN3187_c0_g1~~TRINITY_DN3187_c0_g1_i3.p1  ORF type:complete len:239 (-),score=17.56 TRINITY_DN3187_c0_g1_i3:168-884(-)